MDSGVVASPLVMPPTGSSSTTNEDTASSSTAAATSGSAAITSQTTDAINSHFASELGQEEMENVSGRSGITGGDSLDHNGDDNEENSNLDSHRENESSLTAELDPAADMDTSHQQMNDTRDPNTTTAETPSPLDATTAAASGMEATSSSASDSISTLCPPPPPPSTNNNTTPTTTPIKEQNFQPQYEYFFSLNPFLSKINQLADLLESDWEEMQVEHDSNLELLESELTNAEHDDPLLSESHFSSLLNPNATRVKTLVELFNTEREYLKNLKVLKSDYANPLKAILPQEAHEFIFRHLDSIIAVSEPFYEEMKLLIDERKHDTADVLGFMDIIMRRTPTWRVYADYINHYDDSLIFIRKQRDCNPAFVSFEQSKSNELKERGFRSSKIHSFLVQPVQRIPRVRLLLNDILRRTSPDHPEHEKIQMALHCISNLAAYCNSQKEALESQRKLSSLEKRLNLKNFSEMEDRKFLKEGDVQLDSKTYTMYLFTDTLLLNLKVNGKILRVEMKRSEFEICASSTLMRNSWLAAIHKQQQQFNKDKEVKEEKIHEGWLRKQGGEVRTMKRRWHVLTNQRMKYFDRPNGKIKGSYSLMEGAVVGKWSKKPNGLFIATEERSFFCQAPSEEDRRKWMEKLYSIASVRSPDDATSEGLVSAAHQEFPSES